MKMKPPVTMHSTPETRSYFSSPDKARPLLPFISGAGKEQRNVVALHPHERCLYGQEASSEDVHALYSISSRGTGEPPEKKGWFEAFPGERVKIRVDSDKVGGQFTVLESVVDHDVAMPMHIHTRDEIFYLLEGEVVFSIDGVTSLLQEGSEILVPAGTPHSWRKTSGNPVRALIVFAPGGIEELYLRAGGMTQKEIARLAVEYGTIVVGLPIPIERISADVS
jgi:mannose-6-phosphate isomerase-like protein (cupin superfamily)